MLLGLILDGEGLAVLPPQSVPLGENVQSGAAFLASTGSAVKPGLEYTLCSLLPPRWR